MPIEITDFHFLRPYLLWLLIPVLLIVFYLKHSARKQSAWQNVISPHLLEFLFVSGEKNKVRSSIWLVGLLACSIIIAISGPSVRQKAVPVFETENAQVILLDLSLSMDATDIKPSRLERAKFKLLDVLNQTKEGTVALVVYAGDAFVISPLTSDSNTIANMVPTLSTRIMPVLGSRPDVAINQSIELLKNAKHTRGSIIWLTDGVESKFVDPIISSVQQSHYQLSILAVGTEQGAPIPLPDGNGFLKDNSGAIVIPKLEASSLIEISEKTNAGYVKLTADDKDIEYLQRHQQWQAENSDEAEEGNQALSRWIDDGYWIIWLALSLLLVKIIRQPSGQFNQVNIGITVLLTFGLMTPQPVQAVSWDDLWFTKNQQADKAYAQGNYEKAAELYENQQWQATSQYRNGNFAEAANNFDPEQSIQSLYNHATSMAKSQQLQPALDAYNQLLEKQPDHEDAQFNKKIIEDMLKQQQQQNQQQKDQESDQQNKDQQSQDSESDSQEQQKSDENSEQQQENQQQEQQQSAEEQEQQEAEQKEMEMTEDQRNKSEKDQALEHWLEKIPDDPGGLLRRKMYREYQRRGRQQKEEKLW
ncbi:vWA domain-containing protein [Aliikangiella coralliicola]|nr:VWA domain-containing protein [Aliikangiella coralliicola]